MFVNREMRERIILVLVVFFIVISLIFFITIIRTGAQAAKPCEVQLAEAQQQLFLVKQVRDFYEQQLASLQVRYDKLVNSKPVEVPK